MTLGQLEESFNCLPGEFKDVWAEEFWTKFSRRGGGGLWDTTILFQKTIKLHYVLVADVMQNVKQKNIIV